MALLRVVEHVHELRVALHVYQLGTAAQILYVVLLPTIEQFINFHKLFIKGLISDAVDELEVLNDRLPKERRIATLLLVCVRLAGHYEAHVHLARDELGDFREELREDCGAVDVPREREHIKPIFIFVALCLEIFVSVYMHHTVLGINVGNVQVL